MQHISTQNTENWLWQEARKRFVNRLFMPHFRPQTYGIWEANNFAMLTQGKWQVDSEETFALFLQRAQYDANVLRLVEDEEHLKATIRQFRISFAAHNACYELEENGQVEKGTFAKQDIANFVLHHSQKPAVSVEIMLINENLCVLDFKGDKMYFLKKIKE
jgi:hypothetical protein